MFSERSINVPLPRKRRQEFKQIKLLRTQPHILSSYLYHYVWTTTSAVCLWWPNQKIIIAEEVVERGYKLLVSAIEPAISEAAAKRVEEALLGKKMAPSHLEAAVVTTRIV